MSKDLGPVNGWMEDPKEYIEHLENCSFSDVTIKMLGRCYKEYCCTSCGIVYNVDSSD